MVDLDAARTGEPANRDAVEAIVRAAGVRVEVGGGVRDEADAEALLGAGVARVVVGTAAVADPPLVGRLAARHPGRRGRGPRRPGRRGGGAGLDGRAPGPCSTSWPASPATAWTPSW